VLERMQPASGGFLEATPLTSFVVMSLAGIGRTDHPVVRRGVEFLAASVRQDGSWPIDTNLATWVTTLSLNALAAAGEDVGQRDCLDWLLSCQQREVHPLTGARPGGWGWTDLSGAVPDADDTPGALLALAAMRGALHDGSSLGEDRNEERNEDQQEDQHEGQIRSIDEAAETGLRWLLGLQNSDGGWPTFCRGWGKLPFDRSGVDLTAHALRALHAWRRVRAPTMDAALVGRIDRAIGDGFRFLAQSQRPDGSWVPLWFGNQWHPAEENPVYGTARVLLAYRDLDRLRESPARRGLQWLAAAQDRDGGWGGIDTAEESPPQANVSSVEETAVATDALLSAESDGPWRRAAEEGIAWLVRAVESGRHRETSPIGFYFARLWYYERLYPLVFAVSALGQARRRWCPQPEGRTSRRGATETAR
jgi:squalene-hopene/tetraprenyl-beta-curcumene cyclase